MLEREGYFLADGSPLWTHAALHTGVADPVQGPPCYVRAVPGQFCSTFDLAWGHSCPTWQAATHPLCKPQRPVCRAENGEVEWLESIFITPNENGTFPLVIGMV